MSNSFVSDAANAGTRRAKSKSMRAKMRARSDAIADGLPQNGGPMKMAGRLQRERRMKVELNREANSQSNPHVTDDDKEISTNRCPENVPTRCKSPAPHP